MGRLALAAVLAAGLAGCAAHEGTDEGRLRAVVDPGLRNAAAAAEASFDYQTAASHYATLYERTPDDDALALAYARALRYSGGHATAIAILDDHIARTGAKPALMAELGKANLAADRSGLAVRYLRQAIEGAPGDWELHSALGVAYDYQGRPAEAQTEFKAALELSPDNPVVLNNLALSLAQAGDLEGAVKTLRHAVEQPRASAQVRQNLALLLALDGDPKAAERLARQDLPPDILRENAAYYRILSKPAP